LAHLPLVTAFV